MSDYFNKGSVIIGCIFLSRRTCVAVDGGRGREGRRGIVDRRRFGKDRHVRKVIAIQKRGRANARHALGNRYALKIRTSLESRRANARHVLGDRYALKARTPGERKPADLRHASVLGNHAVFAPRNKLLTFGFDDTVARAVILGISRCNLENGQLGATGKDSEANVRHAGRDRHARKIRAITERKRANVRHALGDRYARETRATRECIIFNMRYTIGYGYAPKPRVPLERRRANTCHASVVGDFAIWASHNKRFAFGFDDAVARAVIHGIPLCHVERGQSGAAGERGRVKARHAVSNVHVRKAIATEECRRANARHALFDGDGLDRGAVGIPRGFSITIICHIPRAADNQFTCLGIERPCKVILFRTAGATVGLGPCRKAKQRGKERH